MVGARETDPLASFFARAAEAASDVGKGAISDIRNKLVEESWFGRVTNDKPGMAEQLGWSTPEGKVQAWDALRERLAGERGPQPDRPHEQEHDRDPGTDR
jgi:hypothetical protein